PATVGSEYLGATYESGATVDAVLHQDVQTLSFSDASFDYVLSFDVLEHVPDEIRALREFFRTLRAGGYLLLTVPFSADHGEPQISAVRDAQGIIAQFMEPEYHGNPVSKTGSLAYRKFGWRLLDDLRAVGFERPEVVTYWSQQLRYYGDPQVAIIACKPRSP